MKRVMQASEEAFRVPDFGPREILKFHAQQGLELKAGEFGRYAGARTWGLGVYREDLLRLWWGLSGVGHEDLKLLLARYGFSKNGSQSLGQMARARGCDKETIRRRLSRIEGDLKKQLLKRQ